MILKLEYLTCFLCLAATLAAQTRNPQPYFRNYNTEDGLPSPEVYVAFEDSKGFMWFGTDNGVARFNGYEFKTYGPKEGLMDNVVFDIHEDGKGRLWFGTLSGEVFILSSERDTILPYRFNGVLKKQIEEHAVRNEIGYLEHLDKDETAYFGTLEIGVIKIDSIGTTKIIKAKNSYSILMYHPEGFERTIFTMSHNFGKRQVSESEFSYIHSKIRNVEMFSGGYYSTQTSFSKTSLTGSDGQKIQSGEFLLYEGNQIHCLKDSTELWSKFSIKNLIEIIPEGKSNIWFCYNGKQGVRKYQNLHDVKSGKFNQYLSEHSISNLFKDSQEGYWFTSLDQGIFYCNNLNLVNYNSEFGFSGDAVVSMDFGLNNEIYAGCKSQSIFLLKEDKILKEIPLYRKREEYSIYFDKATSTLYSGFIKWENEKWVLPKYWNPVIKKYLDTGLDQMANFQITTNNTILGAHRYGLTELDKESHLITLNPTFIKNRRTTAICLNSKNELWVGDLTGIYKYSLTDSTYTSPKINHPTFQSRIEDITELSDSTLAFGTKGYGVMLWKGDNYRQISDQDGLTSNMIEDLHVDENGTLWAGTLNGLNKITFDSLGKPQVRTFTKDNGLPSNEIYQIKSQNGQIWLATGDGLVKFHELQRNTESSPPILLSIEVNNHERKDRAESEFSYDENNFKFHFLAINYRLNGKILYRYRVNSEVDWEYSQNRTVNYPSLNPDNYSFEVQGQNEDGYWSDSMSYEFCVLSPWWATWWFRLFVASVLGFLGYSFYKYRTGQLKKEADAQRRENEFLRQITDLEKSALQAQMNPHFIFNSLNSIQNFILKNDRKKAVEYLARFAKLVRYNLNASVNGEVSLEDEINLLDHYLALERERFDGRFDYEMEVADKLKEEFVEFPPMLIQPYVENAIIHGISKKEKKGLIKIKFDKMPNGLTVKITDNGSGFDSSKNNNSPKQHKSVGMTITQKRLELLGAAPDSSVKIRTLLNSENQSIGTEVLIFIKTILK